MTKPDDPFLGPNCGFKSFYWSWSWRRWKFSYLKDETTSALTHNEWRNLWIGPLLLTGRKVTLVDDEGYRSRS